MSQCPKCGYVYDESEYVFCPKCTGNWKKKYKNVKGFVVLKSLKK